MDGGFDVVTLTTSTNPTDGKCVQNGRSGSPPNEVLGHVARHATSRPLRLSLPLAPLATDSGSAAAPLQPPLAGL